MSNKKQYVGMPSANQSSQTATLLSRFADNNSRENMFLDRKNQIREIAENRIAAKKSKTPKQKKVKAPTMDDLATMVQNHNDYVYAFDLPDPTINYEDYFNKDDPSFIDSKEGLGEEMKYVQNRIYKLQGDKRYVPDYEDVRELNDSDYEKYMTGLITGTIDPKQKEVSIPANKLDTMSDKNFTKILDSKI